jgi:uncharacterized lipoprotein YmbA
LALGALASACASAPPETFYTLTAGVRRAASDDGASARPPSSPGGRPAAPSVVVTPAALPGLVDRPQLVLADGETTVVLLEQQRWAEPLRAQIARVVAEDLGRLLGTWRVAIREDAIPTPDCRVSLDVQRFESSRRGPAFNETLWTVVCADGVMRTGRSAASEPLVSPAVGDTLAPVVAAHGRALDRMSREIAQTLREAAP